MAIEIDDVSMTQRQASDLFRMVADATGAGAPCTPGTLRQVHSLDDLVGSTPVGAAPEPVGTSLPGVQAVVLGDSTAAGLGNPLVRDPSGGMWVPP